MNAEDSDWQPLTDGLPESPQVRALLVHPDDPAVIFAGTQDGPYRSGDGGDSWQRTDFPDPDLPVWSLTVHPTDHSILYAGTAPAMVYRSDDRGEHWSRLPDPGTGHDVQMGFPTRLISLTLDPTEPDTIYAGVEVGGVRRSTDAGQTWTDSSSHLGQLADENPRLRSRLFSDTEREGMLDTHALAMSTAAPGVAFLAVRMGVFRSSDGVEWSDLNVGRYSPLTYCRDITFAEHDPRVLYACLSDESQGQAGSLYRSNDLGESWFRYDKVTPASTLMQVSPHPTNPEQVWCATREGEVFATADGGQTWTAHPLPTGGRDVYALASG